MLRTLYRTFIVNSIETAFTLATAVVIILFQRWLLELSTPSKDWIWFQGTETYRYFERVKRVYKNLSWYRGTEAIHQSRAKGVLSYES